MAVARRPLTVPQVAEELGVSACTVRKHWPDWHRTQGFPKPLPLTGNGRLILRWDAAALATWKILRSGLSEADLDTTDWATIARARGEALDRGEDPDIVWR